MTKDKASAPTSNSLRGATRRLVAEVGALQAFEHGVREVIGNTNWVCLQKRGLEAEAALASESAPTSNVAAQCSVDGSLTLDEAIAGVVGLYPGAHQQALRRLGELLLKPAAPVSTPPQEQAPRDALPVPEISGHLAERCGEVPPTAGMPSPSGSSEAA